MQILTTNLTSLPVHMRLFSLSMRSMFTDKAVGSSSSTAGRFRELRDRTRNDAVAYLQGVLPVVKGCVADIIEYFEYYEFLSMDEWWKNIHDIIDDVDVRLFSRSMISLYKDKRLCLLGLDYQKLRNSARDDAIVYQKSVLPIVTACVGDIIQYFEIFESLRNGGTGFMS